MVKAALARLASGSLIYGAGSTLQRFMALLLLPLYTRALTPEDYGVVAIISLLSVAMSGLFTLGTGNSMGVIYYREREPRRRSTIVWTNTLLMTVNSLWWFGVLYLAAPALSRLMFHTEQHAGLMRLSVLGLVFITVADPWLAFLRMEAKAKTYVVLTLMGSLLSVGLSIWLVLVQRIGVTGVVLAGTLAHGIMLVVCWVAIGRKLSFGVDKALLWPLVRIGFPSVLGLFAFLLIDYADRQMIERMVGLDALGVYSVGYSFGMVMSIAIGAFATAWPPFFMSFIHRADEARIVFGRVLTYYVIGFGALTVLFFCVAKPVVVIMTAPEFHGAFVVVGLVATGYMLKGCYLIVLPGLYYAEKLHKQTAVEWVAAVVNIGLNLWLIPVYGILGAAIATMLSYGCLPLLAWAAARRYLVVDYEWRRIAGTSTSVLLTSWLLFWLSTNIDASVLVTVLTNAIVLLTFIGLAYRLLLTATERELVWSKLIS